MTLAIRTWGPPGGTPLVLLHGFLGSAGDWAAIAPALDGYRCIAPDLPAHGQSAPTRPVSMTAWIAALADTLDALGVARCALAGYSLGGRIALHFALAHPQRVSSLLLFSASPGLEANEDRDARAESDDAWAARLMRDDREGFLRAWYAQPLFARLVAQPELLAQVLRERALGDPAELAAVVRAMSPGRLPSLWKRLRELHLPLLYLAGEHDERYAAAARRVADLCPGAVARIVRRSGHAIHLENPAAVIDALRQFPRVGSLEGPDFQALELSGERPG